VVTILRDIFSRRPNPIADNYSQKIKLCFEKYPEKMQHYNPIWLMGVMKTG
jgi:hypothetical protein